jgi:hypothetical protein
MMTLESAFNWVLTPFRVIFTTRGGAAARIVLLSRYTLLSMALGTVPLVALPQGRDLLVALADKGAPVEHRVFFYLTLAVWGLSVWYWSRVVLDAALVPVMGAEYRGLARHLPRIFGIATTLLPAFPIAFASNGFWEKVAMIAGCVALAAALGALVTKRKSWFPMARGGAVRGFSISLLRGTAASLFAIASLALSVGLFLLFVFAPLDAGRYLGAVAIFFIAAANTVFFGNVAVFVSETFGVRLELAALALAAVFSLWNDNHDVRPQRLSRSLPALEHQFCDWRAQLSNAAGPVFLVAAEGGGIRAAYWTATVLGALNEGNTREFGHRLFAVSGVSGGTLGAAVYAALRHEFPEGDLNLRRTGQAVLSHDFLSPTVAKLVTGDFLQWFWPLPVAAFDRSTAIEAAFTRAYEDEVKPKRRAQASQPTLAGPITTLAPDPRAGVPAVVMNMTLVDRGGRALIAPFTFDAAEIPDATLYACWVGSCQAQTPTYAAPPLAKAIHNSARFTYISPAGLVRGLNNEKLGHVVDGGYFDPTGVDTLLDIATALTAAFPDVTLVPIYITNQAVASDINDAALREVRRGHLSSMSASAGAAAAQRVEATNEEERAASIEILGEVFAPVQALFQSRDAHGRLAAARQHRRPMAVTFGLCVMREEPEGHWVEQLSGTREEKRDEPPLGWQLSRTMTRRLDAYWRTCSANVTGAEIVEEALKK